MAAVEAAAAEAQPPISAEVVGNAFVQQYYHILHHSPELVYQFYKDISKLGRAEEDGSMSITTTMEAINEKIVSLNYGDLRAEIKSVDAQDTSGGGVHVLVTGYLKGKDDKVNSFAQTFFLAPQDNGYFVLNDMFRYLNQSTPPPEEAISGEVFNPPENGDVAIAEEAVVVVVDEVQNEPELVVESHSKIEEVPKKSYASIVMHLKESAASFSPPPVAPTPRKAPPKGTDQFSPTVPAPNGHVSSLDSIDNEHNQEGEADGYSIYIKGLPMNATEAQLDEVFSTFGTTKKDGIQVRSNRIDKNAKSLHRKEFVFYDDWCEIFGKDRANGAAAEDCEAAAAAENEVTQNFTEDVPHTFFNLIDEDDADPEEVSESYDISSSVGKRSVRKRKRNDNLDPKLSIVKKYCESTHEMMRDIAKRIGFEQDMSDARKKVFDIISTMEDLTLQEQLRASQLIARNAEDLDVFLSLHAHGREEWTRMKLSGKL